MISVLDTSVIMRLYIPDGPLPEQLEPSLAEAQRGNHRLLAPQLMLAEVANVLRKRTRLKEINTHEGVQILQAILDLPVVLFGHAPLIQGAYELALEHGLSGYDGLFLALARQQDARLFSCDLKLLKVAHRLGLDK